jgi:hypothetical protein
MFYHHLIPSRHRPTMVFICPEVNCRRRFQRRYSLKNHYNALHGEKIVEKCFLCGQIFEDRPSLEEHYSKYHKPSRHFIVKESAFNKNVITYRYNYLQNEIDPTRALLGVKNIIRRQIELETAQKIMTKVSLIFICEMTMTDYEGQKISTATIPFRSPAFMASSMRPHVIDKHIQIAFNHHQSSLDQFINQGSNWVFQRALCYDVEIAKMKALRVGTASVNISNLKNKNFLYNPPNRNNKCFLYCIAYFLLFGLLILRKPTPTEELSIKKKAKTFNTSKMKFPTSLDDLKRFLKNNPHLDLSINVLYRGTDEVIYPLEFGLGQGKKIINLLLVNTKKGAHFLLIKNVDKFLRQKYTTVDKNSKNKVKHFYQKVHFCLNCLNSFSVAKLRDEHLQICCLNKPRKEVTPKENENIIKFKNVEHQSKLDYIGFLDFECVLPDIRKKCPMCQSLKCKCENSSTCDINEQIPFTYSLVILGPNELIIHERTKSCKNAHIDLVKHLLEQEDIWIKNALAIKEEIRMTPKEEQIFHKTTKCYMCKVFFSPDVVKCRDHSHSTGKFLGAACQSCNLRRRRPRLLKLFMHNASRYDMHFIIQAMAHFPDMIKNISVLPYNGEHFRTLRFNCFQFLDTMSFLPSSLAQLSTDLSQTNHEYKILKQTYLNANDGIDDILKKGFFPYEYCTSYSKMKNTKQLPPIEAFRSVLSETTIKPSEHTFAQKMWKKFECENLIDYAEIYCKIDTILLAEIFIAFRNKMFQFTKLDPSWYLSLPSFAFDTMLKVTKNEIELPTDINIIQFLEQAKRGGVSFVNNRYLKINNDNEDIVNVDLNNLYGHSQMSKLPYKDFRFLDEDEISLFDITSIDLDGQKGYFIECDLNYPQHLHKHHSNFPLASEVLKVTYEHLSPYAKNAVLLTTGKQKYEDTKLMATFHKRNKYITHMTCLKLYLSLGLELIKIHRILEFTQARIFAPYIEMTTAARQQSKTKFEMNLYKLMVSNSKSLQNI